MSLDLDAIEARCEAATEGPWTATGSQVWHDGELVAAVREHSISERRPDAEFIAHAREDTPALVAEVERLRERLVITDELVEQAARAAHDQQARLHGLTPWDETGACAREPWLHQQRAALEAALGGEHV